MDYTNGLVRQTKCHQ